MAEPGLEPRHYGCRAYAVNAHTASKEQMFTEQLLVIHTPHLLSFCFVPDTREGMEDREINKALTRHVFIYFFLTSCNSEGSLKKKNHRVLLDI